jgi:hypothetical protein
LARKILDDTVGGMKTFFQRQDEVLTRKRKGCCD